MKIFFTEPEKNIIGITLIISLSWILSRDGNCFTGSIDFEAPRINYSQL